MTDEPVKFAFGSGFNSPAEVSDKLRYLLCLELFGFSPHERVLTAIPQLSKFFFLIFNLLRRGKDEEFASAYEVYFAEEVEKKAIVKLKYTSIPKLVMCNLKIERMGLLSASEIVRNTFYNTNMIDFLRFLKEGEKLASPHRSNYGYLLEKILERWWSLGLHSSELKSYVNHDKLYFINNCRRCCRILLAIRKRQTTILNCLPKDIVVYLAKITWTTKFDVLAWTTGFNTSIREWENVE
jgi:hypothetical protein